jgi:D-alanyl-D-alanine carboxypeptidase
MGRRLIVAMLSAAVVSCALAGQATASPKTELGTSLSRLVKSGAPGAALYVRRGGATTRVARGLSAVAGRRPMRAADTFRVGSLTKTYIATLVVQLAAEHKLSLDDPVATSLPGLIPGGEAITIRQLLDHTSGIYDYENDPRVLEPYFGGNLAYHWAPRDLVAVAVSHPPLFAPGARYEYSNTNYLIAGLIVEAVTGSTLADQLQQRVVGPLEFRHTGLQLSARRGAPEMHGYFVFDRPPATDITGLSPYPWAAGAITANVSEVAQFYRALLTGRLVDPAALSAMKTTVSEGKAGDFRGSRYGLGIESYPTRCGTAWGHGGNFPGYLVYALTSANGKRQAVLVINEDPLSLPKRFGPMFFKALKRAYCGAR